MIDVTYNELQWMRLANENRKKANMQTFIGNKRIEAEPQEKDGQEGYKVIYDNGYESWSPKDVFEKAYREVGKLTFSEAIELLKRGKNPQRAGWHGKNMCLVAVEDTKLSVPVIYLVRMDLLQVDPVYDYLGVWNCTQADMLAEDWQIVE